MTDYPVYKRTKTNWWMIILFGGIYIWVIFAYIFQWGNSPVNKAGLIITALVFIVALLAVGRFTIVVDDKLVLFKSDLWTPVKIPIIQIKKIVVMRSDLWETATAKIEKYSFDFTRIAINIQLKNGKAYQIAIKDAEQIKNEIEKRILNTNNKHQ